MIELFALSYSMHGSTHRDSSFRKPLKYLAFHLFQSRTIKTGFQWLCCDAVLFRCMSKTTISRPSFNYPLENEHQRGHYKRKRSLLGQTSVHFNIPHEKQQFDCQQRAAPNLKTMFQLSNVIGKSNIYPMLLLSVHSLSQ